MLKNSLLISLTILAGFTSESFGQHLTQTAVICLPDCDNYHGPMNDYDVPGGSKGLNDRTQEAYRYGYVQELREYQGQIENQIIEFNVSVLGEMASAADIEKIEAEVRQNLLTTYPTPSPSVLDHEVRRQVNPLPKGMAEETLQKQIDPVWKAVEKRDAVELATQLADLNEKMIPLAGSGDSEILEQQSVMINSEFAISEVTNDQGLIKAPFADTPDELLYTSPTTFNGADVRAGINAHLAAQSEIGKKCAGTTGAAADACAQFNAHVKGQVAAYYALDKMASQGFQVSAETRELFYSMGTGGQIALGVGRGVANGTIQFVEGIKMLMADPAGTAVALGNAMMNFTATSRGIARILESKAADFMAGNAEIRAEILSEAAVQVAALFVPGADVAAIVQGSVFLKTGVYLSMAGTAEAVAMSGVLVRAAIVAESAGVVASKLDDFTTRIGPILDSPDGSFITARLATGNPGRAEFVAGLGETLANASNEARVYVAGLVAYESKIFRAELTAADTGRIASAYDDISSKVSALEKGAAREVEFTRAIPTTRIQSGPNGEQIIIQQSMSDVMNFHKGGLEESHRITRPMREGFYGSTGPNAIETAVAEATAAMDNGLDYWVDTRKMSLENPLDLTNAGVRERLGISLEDIKRNSSSDSFAYETTQILGELAEKNGFDSVIFPSTAHEGGTNIVIFRKKPTP